MGHQLIGEILKETCGLTEEALSQGLKTQEEKGGRIGEILIRQKAISEDDLLKALGVQFDMPVSSTLPLGDLKTDFTEQVPIQFLKKYKMVPVISSSSAFIATNDPLLFQPLDDLGSVLSLNGTNAVLAPHSAIISVINFAYDMRRDSAEQVIQDMHEEDSDMIMSEISEIEETGVKINCVKCHMPRVKRAIAMGAEEERVGGRHLWRGGHDQETVKKAIQIELKENITQIGIFQIPVIVNLNSS